jgi:hypothetical protein
LTERHEKNKKKKKKKKSSRGGTSMSHPRLDATKRDHVIKAARSNKPKPIQKWSCVVPVNGGKYVFPVKQLLLAAANLVESSDEAVTPADFTAHMAVSKLKKLDFEVCYSDE